MKHFNLIIFFILWTSGSHAKLCLNQSEIKETLMEFQHDLLDLIPQNMPLPSLVYRDLDLDVSGYTDFNDAKNISIHLLGHKCKNKFFKDEIRLLLCHELGHIVGGEPFMFFRGVTSGIAVSAEGQADYYATSICLPHILGKEDNSSFAMIAKNNAELSLLCPQEDVQKRGLCARIAEASLQFAIYNHQAIQESANETIPPKDPGVLPDLSKHDSNVVESTLLRAYPSPLCRLDTLIAGFNKQSRPSCWFK